MPQLFSKRANKVPRLVLVSLIATSTALVLFIWYYFSPKYLEVGYMPEQPIAYSHALHAGQLGIDCQYCHNSVTVSAKANIPPTETCMNCHSQIKTDSPKLAPLREAWETGKPIEWVKVHKVADYAHFNHAAHVNVGIGCVSCHGRVDRMEVVYQAQPLSMGWCLDCHRAPEEHLRPVDQITNMSWERPKNEDPIAYGRKIVEAKNIHAPQYCNGCHY